MIWFPIGKFYPPDGRAVLLYSYGDEYWAKGFGARKTVEATDEEKIAHFGSLENCKKFLENDSLVDNRCPPFVFYKVIGMNWFSESGKPLSFTPTHFLVPEFPDSLSSPQRIVTSVHSPVVHRGWAENGD